MKTILLIVLLAFAPAFVECQSHAAAIEAALISSL